MLEKAEVSKTQFSGGEDVKLILVVDHIWISPHAEAQGSVWE